MVYFPDDCLELIFQKLREDNERDLDSISLVSKRFLSISNRVKHSLIVNANTLQQLPNLLRRFGQIKSIVISTGSLNDIPGLFYQIARSGVLNLQAIRFRGPTKPPRDGFRALALNKNIKNSLKVLDCSWLSMQDKDLVLIAGLFPQIKELKICAVNDDGLARITDAGVDALASKLKELKEIVLASNKCFITDKSLISLSTNCVKLKKIHLCISSSSQNFVTEDGIGFVMRNSTNLTSLSLNFMSLQPSAIGNGFFNAKNLHSLTLCQQLITEKCISLLAKACPPLKKLELTGFMGKYPEMNEAFKLLLYACQLTLEELTLSFWCLRDTGIADLAQYLTNLTSISLRGHGALTSVAVYTLTKSCPLLEILTMTHTRGQKMSTFSPDVLHKNYRMRHLDISYNMWVNDTTLENFGHVCPNLQFLSVGHCLRLTDVGFGEVLKRCPAITQLTIDGLQVSNIFERYSDHSVVNLNSLKARETQINDKGMAMIGNRCPNLQYLDIESCKEVTDKGVMEVVRNCKRLRDISLYECEKVSTNILPQLAFSWLSPRKICSPCWFGVREQMINTISSSGCRLSFRP